MAGEVVCGSDHFFFMDAVATVDALSGSNNEVKLVEIRTIHFARLKSSPFLRK